MPHFMSNCKLSREKARILLYPRASQCAVGSKDQPWLPIRMEKPASWALQKRRNHGGTSLCAARRNHWKLTATIPSTQTAVRHHLILKLATPLCQGLLQSIVRKTIIWMVDSVLAPIWKWRKKETWTVPLESQTSTSSLLITRIAWIDPFAQTWALQPQ